MRFLILILISALTTRADWQAFVNARAQAGADDLTIRRELVRPSRVAETNMVEIAKTAERVELEQAAASAVSSLVALIAPQVPAGDRLATVARMNAKQLRDRVRAALPAMTAANQREVQNLIAELLTYYAAAPDMWPPSADFGQASKTVQVVTYSAGPSRWDILRPVDSDPTPPSLSQIREAMK